MEGLAMARVAGYIRKSDRERPRKKSKKTQPDQKETPLETQRQVIRDWCQEHNHELVGFYEDPDCRNTVPVHQREDGGRLLRDADRGKMDIVACYRLDRWARKGAVAHEGWNHLHRAGVGFASCTEPINFTTPDGKLMLGVLLSLAEWERDTIEKRCTDGMQRRAAEGKYCGGVTRYGCRVIDEYLVPDTEPLPGLGFSEADVVRMIFDWHVSERLSTYAIARRLAEMGIPTAHQSDGEGKMRHNWAETSGAWRADQVRSILRNPAYKGVAVWGASTRKKSALATAQPVQQQVPPLVSEPLWEAAQRQLEANRQTGGRNSKRPTLLRGLLKCECGHTFVIAYGRKRKGEDDKPRYYACFGRLQKHRAFGGSGKSCSAPYLPADDLERDAWAVIADHLEHPGETLVKLQAGWDQQHARQGSLTEVRDAVRRALDTKERQRGTTVDLLVSGVLRQEEAEAKLSRLREEVDVLTDRLAELDAEAAALGQRQGRLQQAGEFLSHWAEQLNRVAGDEDRMRLAHDLIDQAGVACVDGVWRVRLTLCFAPTEERMVSHTRCSWIVSGLLRAA
jgi:site-specific DNA recombinase